MSRNYGELTKYSFLLGHRFRCPTDDESCTSLKVIERERERGTALTTAECGTICV